MNRPWRTTTTFRFSRHEYCGDAEEPWLHARKVILILNDEALESTIDKPDFQQYLEKVVDTFLQFTPSAAESVRIALNTDTDTTKWLAESCVTLGISNIRVIRKIEAAVRRIEPMLKQFDPQVLNNTVRSLTLLGWAVQPTNPGVVWRIFYPATRLAQVFP